MPAVPGQSSTLKSGAISSCLHELLGTAHVISKPPPPPPQTFLFLFSPTHVSHCQVSRLPSDASNATSVTLLMTLVCGPRHLACFVWTLLTSTPTQAVYSLLSPFDASSARLAGILSTLMVGTCSKFLFVLLTDAYSTSQSDMGVLQQQSTSPYHCVCKLVAQTIGRANTSSMPPAGDKACFLCAFAQRIHGVKNMSVLLDPQHPCSVLTGIQGHLQAMRAVGVE